MSAPRTKHPGELFWREPGNDRALLSANDWYGYGFLMGVTGEHPQPGWCRWYCGKTGAYEQYHRGYYAGAEVAESSPALADGQPPE